jgi:hypothetical protein
MTRALAAALAATLLCACITAPPPQTETELRREQISLAQQRTVRALARGDYRAARAQAQLALDGARASRDPEAIGTGLLNLAAVLHRSGELAEARARLAELLQYQPPFGPAYAGRAEARLALIELQSNRLEEASRHAQRAEALCAASACAWRHALNDVQAAIAAGRGRAAGAREAR